MGNKKPEDPPLLKLFKGLLDIYYDWKERREAQKRREEIDRRTALGEASRFSMKEHKKQIVETAKAMKKRK